MRIYTVSLLVFAVLTCAPCSLPAQESEATSEATTVRKLEEKWTESYKHRQIAILSSLFADDFVITVEDGVQYSKAGYISHTADTSVRVDVAELSDLKVRLHGNVAVVTGAYYEKGESNGKPYEYHDRLTDIWMKIGGRWQVIASHYSVPAK